MVNIQGVLYFGSLFLLLFESTYQQQFTLSSPAELAALLDLRSSLGLRSKDWPRKADPCLIWTGIHCDDGRIIGINISGFRRTRIGRQNPQFSVDSLANFTLLQSFNASNFLLPSPIPDWFGLRLRSLQVVDLRSCSIIGIIPSSFGNLTNLTALYLSDNNLTGTIPASFGQLIRLSVLDLSHNSLSKSIPLSLTSLTNLTLLDLSSNSLSSSIPPGIGMLSKLQYLNLSTNNLSSSIPAQLGDLGSLVGLDLSFNSLSGSVPRDLRGLSNLQKMVIGNNLLRGPLPEDLFSSLQQLQFVVLRHNDFAGIVPGGLWSMPGLHLLDLAGNSFTGELPNSSSNANATAAAVLNISQNVFYGGIKPLIRKFSLVVLSGNYFEGKIPEYVPTNASLQSNCLQNVLNQRTLAECSSFYAQRGLSFDNFGLPNFTQPPAAETSRKSNRKVIILGSVVGGFGLIVLLVLLVLLCLCLRRRGMKNQREIGVGSVSAGGNEPIPGVSINFLNLGDAFTHEQLLQATDGFSDSNLIKHGRSGDLFRGIIEKGTVVVIKRVDLRSTKKELYLTELDFFSKVSHTRLVPLLGHCLENENEKFLVYKFMPNGDLSSSFYRKSTTTDDDEGVQSLDWITRLKIALGAAEGLTFLHHECTPPLVHRDVQATSILLDDKFEVRLGSLSDVCPQEGDVHQNRITRFLRFPQTSEQGSGSLTAICSYDVYCFGKVLLELVTGKLGISASSDAQVKEWLEQTLPYISIYDKELVTKIVDPSLIVDEDFLEEVWAMAVVARSCLNPKPSRRPQMRYVLKALENPLKVVREENSSSGRLRATSSRGSWNAALFGSWRHSLSDLTIVPAAASSLRAGGNSSQGSGQNNGSSRRRHSKEICPEPSDEPDVERLDQE